MPSRLSSLLVRDGLVGVKRMEKAFQRQVIYGGSLDTILLEMNQIPISSETKRTGAALVTYERPVGERHSSPTVCQKYVSSTNSRRTGIGFLIAQREMLLWFGLGLSIAIP